MKYIFHSNLKSNPFIMVYEFEHVWQTLNKLESILNNTTHFTKSRLIVVIDNFNDPDTLKILKKLERNHQLFIYTINYEFNFLPNENRVYIHIQQTMKKRIYTLTHRDIDQSIMKNY